MNTGFLIYVIILVLVIGLALYVNKKESDLKNKYKMSFMESMNLTGLPVVTFENGNKKFNFLLDTGASFSVINKTVLKKIKHTKSNESGTIFGMEGNVQTVEYTSINLKYKDKEFKEDFQIVDMNVAFDNVKKESGVTICGILGSKFFEANKYVLDFKELTAYIRK